MLPQREEASVNICPINLVVKGTRKTSLPRDLGAWPGGWTRSHSPLRMKQICSLRQNVVTAEEILITCKEISGTVTWASDVQHGRPQVLQCSCRGRRNLGTHLCGDL